MRPKQLGIAHSYNVALNSKIKNNTHAEYNVEIKIIACKKREICEFYRSSEIWKER